MVSETELEPVVERLRVLGHPTRLRLLGELHAEGELSVGDLARRAGLSCGAVSKQLAVLRGHGLISRRREGNRIYYRLSNPSIGQICAAVSGRVRDVA